MADDVDSMLQSDELFFLMGPCVIEAEGVMTEAAEELASLREEFGVSIVFKSSFDKANRTSVDSYRGPGLEDGLEILETIGNEYDFPLITDIHEPHQADPVSDVVDVLQIPAFLCRQTDLILAAGETGLPVNIKKGQFLDPESMKHSVDKARHPETSNDHHLATERGSVFGYNRWVVDMRNLVTMRQDQVSIVYDATHSVQLPGARGGSSGGQREFIAPQARAAVATGLDGIFMETHPNPEEALCDGPNMLPLEKAEIVVESLLRIHEVSGEYRNRRVIEDDET